MDVPFGGSDHNRNPFLDRRYLHRLQIVHNLGKPTPFLLHHAEENPIRWSFLAQQTE